MYLKILDGYKIFLSQDHISSQMKPTLNWWESTLLLSVKILCVWIGKYVHRRHNREYVRRIHNRGPCCHRQKSPTWECVIDASVGKRTRQPQIRRNARAAQWQCWNTHKLQIQRMPSFSPGNLRHMCILHLYQENHFHIFSNRNTENLW